MAGAWMEPRSVELKGTTQDVFGLTLAGARVRAELVYNVWTSGTIDELTGPMLEVKLLMWSEDLAKSTAQGGYDARSMVALQRLASGFAEVVGASAAYLTDEITDGLPWEAVVERKSPEDYWVFDMAVIDKLPAGFAPVPDEYFQSSEQPDAYWRKKLLRGD